MRKYVIKKIKKDREHYKDDGDVIKCSYGKDSAINRAKRIAKQKAREYEDNGYNVILEIKGERDCLYGDILTVQVTRKSHNLFAIDYYYIEEMN
jgi:hypothetical protein